MNKVILIGNLAADPELKRTQSDIAVCTFRLAVQRKFTNQQGIREADFFNIVAWRQTAEVCARYLLKGRKCAVVGNLQTRSYDAKDGTKRTVVEVVADEVEFLTPQQQAGQPYDINRRLDDRKDDPFPSYPRFTTGTDTADFDNELPF